MAYFRSHSLIGPGLDETTYPDFCTELYQRSFDLLEESDRLANLKLAAAVTDRQIYVDILGDFYVVFSTMERELRRIPNHPCIKGLLSDELLRTGAFEQDLAFYLGTNWQENIHPSDAAKSYCDHIIEVARKNPTLMLA